LTFNAFQLGRAIKTTVKICAFCESEAELSVDGTFLCKECSSKPESKIARLKAAREIHAVLHREVLASTAFANTASEKLRAIMEDIPSGLPQPDGSQRIQNAAHALAAARNAMMRAHSRLDEFLAHGAVPVDFEPGGPA
jgi:hypothetical protein